MSSTLTLWNRSDREFTQWVDSFFRGDNAVTPAVPLIPRVNASHSEKEVVLSFDLPGVEEKDIQLNVTSEGLAVSGEKKGETDENGKTYYRLERTSGAFQRIVPLPDDIEAEKAVATFRNGVLRIVLPKNENRNPRRAIRITSTP